MNKITVRIKNSIIYPTNDYDKQQLTAFKDDEYYQVKITKPRNLKHHRKYWALMSALAFHFEGTAEQWHWSCKESFLVKETRINNITGERVEHVPSTAFDKLDQLGFNKYYEQIERHLVNIGYDPEELIENS